MKNTNRTITIFTLLTFTMIGCSSFNSSVYVMPIMDIATPTAKANVAVAENVTPQHLDCPVYKMPQLPKVPEIPVSALSKINKNDDLAMDEIQQRHIGEMRQWARDSRKMLQDSYEKYLKSCGVQ